MSVRPVFMNPGDGLWPKLDLSVDARRVGAMKSLTWHGYPPLKPTNYTYFTPSPNHDQASWPNHVLLLNKILRTAMTSTLSNPVRIAVLLPCETQLLDLACIDLFAIMSQSYLSAVPFLPTSISSLAPDVTFSYVGTTPSIPLTTHTSLQLTHSTASPSAAPGNFDIIVVPGQHPDATFSTEVKEWLAAQGREEATDVLCVCTGVFLCGEAGLLRGRRVCGPRGLQGEIKKRFGGEGIELVGERLRWVDDGRFWSCGGVTNGNDLVAAYARRSKRFPAPVVEFALQMADVGDRPQEYGKSQAVFTAGIVWTLIKAWVWGFKKSKSG